MAIVAKSDDGKEIMILDNGFAAWFKDGAWIENIVPNGYALGHRFIRVEDISQANAIINEARKALATPN